MARGDDVIQKCVLPTMAMQTIVKKLHFFALGVMVLTGLLTLGGCASNEEFREAYKKENAARRGHRELVGYCREKHLDLNTFKGPYFHESLGLDFPSYTVCYKHPVHYFCYHDYTSSLDAGILTPEQWEDGLPKWLKEQPDIEPTTGVSP